MKVATSLFIFCLALAAFQLSCTVRTAFSFIFCLFQVLHCFPFQAKSIEGVEERSLAIDEEVDRAEHHNKKINHPRGVVRRKAVHKPKEAKKAAGKGVKLAKKSRKGIKKGVKRGRKSAASNGGPFNFLFPYFKQIYVALAPFVPASILNSLFK